MGRAKNYLLRLPNQGGKSAKALQGKGYSGYQIECDISNVGRGGGTRAKTISIEDYLAYVEYEFDKGNPIAIALLKARARQGLRDDIFAAFKRAPSNPAIARKEFYKSLAQSFSNAEWFETSLPDGGYDLQAMAPHLTIMFDEGFTPTALLRGWDLDAWAAEYEC